MSASQFPLLPQQLPKTQADWDRVCNTLQNWRQQLMQPLSLAAGSTVGGYSIGYLGLPVNQISSNYTPLASDVGKLIQGYASLTLTLPKNVFSIGQTFQIGVGAGATITIEGASGVTLSWVDGGNTTGTRTLTGCGLVTITWESATAANVSGFGLS